jgi:membrane associated rhomboid family serine protease
MRTTNFLILVCIAVTLYALYGADPTSVERNLAFSLKNMQEGRVWTLITEIFVHASLIHLLGNMIFLPSALQGLLPLSLESISQGTF